MRAAEQMATEALEEKETVLQGKLKQLLETTVATFEESLPGPGQRVWPRTTHYLHQLEARLNEGAAYFAR